MELSIVIPAYNEEKRLPNALKKMFDHLYAHYHSDYEVIIADDASTDRTADIVREFMNQYPQLRLERFNKNRGRGAALRDAIKTATGAFILETDADGSTGEQAIVQFLKYFAAHPEVDMLIGSRTLKGSRILTYQPPLRVFLGYCFMGMAYILFGWKLVDRVNGFKMFRHDVAKDIFAHQYDNTFLGEAEVVFIADKRGYNVVELPIEWTDYSGSKVRSFKESVRSFIGMFKILNRNRKGLYSN